MRKLFVLAILFSFSAVMAKAGEQDGTEPQGTPVALIFSNFHTRFADGETSKAFEIKRAYLGYRYTFNPQWYGYIVLDVGDPEAGDHQFAAFLKNAYLRYRESNLTFLFGMIPTTQFKVAENIWGLRYIEESYQDLYGFNSSADLGFTVQYQFADFIGADFSVYNGEGYQHVQSDDFLRPALGLTLNPVNELTARFYADMMGGDVKQTSLSAFLAYETNQLTASAEYNYQQNVGMTADRDRFGPSFFITYSPVPNVKVFGRFDQLSSNTLEGDNAAWQINRDGQLVMAGVEYAPIRGVKFAPNYRLWNPENSALAAVNSIYLNCEIRF